MRASVYNEYGPPEVLHVEQIEKPTPSAKEVLIRVRASSVNFGDLIARDFASVSPRQFRMPWLFWLGAKFAFGLRRPRIRVLGNEFSGEVVAVGSKVRRFAVGDAVFGYLGERMGAYAEFVSVPEDAAITKKPANLSFDEAASTVYGPVMAFGILRNATITAGQRVLVNGASGSIGTAAVQLARIAGAHVTGVCSGPRVAMVKELGAEQVIDYTREDFTQRNERYDVIIDVLGRASFAQCKRVLTDTGRLVYVSFKSRQLAQMLWTKIVGGPRVLCTLAPGSLAELEAVTALLEAKKLKPTIDRTFTLEHVAEAHRYASSRERVGAVVVSIANEPD